MSRRRATLMPPSLLSAHETNSSAQQKSLDLVLRVLRPDIFQNGFRKSCSKGTMSEHIPQLMIQERDSLSAAITALKSACPASTIVRRATIIFKLRGSRKAKRKMIADGRAKIVAAAKKGDYLALDI
jgi:hypothetical protein